MSRMESAVEVIIWISLTNGKGKYLRLRLRLRLIGLL